MSHALDVGITPDAIAGKEAQAEMARKLTPVSSGAPIELTQRTEDAPIALARAVGENLRRLRRRQGYSLEKLSKLSSVSRAMLGQIETGRSVPTVSLLAKISLALDVSVASLLTPQDTIETDVLRAGKTHSIVSSEGRFVARALFPLGGERKVEFYEVTIAPAHIELAKAHAPGTRENLTIVHGSVEIQIGRERPIRLGDGDSVVFAADQPHTYRNLGSEPAVLYLVVTYANGTA